MTRTILALAVDVSLGLGGGTAARHDGAGEPKRAVLSTKDVVEKIDGKEARATTVELTIGPGRASPPHRHPGPVFGYALEGEYEWAIDDQPARVLKAGETFYEPTGVPAPDVEEPVGGGRGPRPRGRAAPARCQADHRPGAEEGLTPIGLRARRGGSPSL